MISAQRIKEHTDMNADLKSNILSIALEAKQLELERARMQLEDQQSKIVRATANLTEEVSYIQAQLYSRRNANSTNRSMYDAASDALEILDPGHPENYAES